MRYVVQLRQISGVMRLNNTCLLLDQMNSVMDKD